MLFAQWFFWVHSVPKDQKISRYENLNQVYKSSGKKPPGLEGPDLPDQCVDIWDAFTKLKDVSFTELKNYMDVTGNQLDAWEIDLIIGFDRMRRTEQTWPPNG